MGVFRVDFEGSVRSLEVFVALRAFEGFEARAARFARERALWASFDV